MTTNRPLRVFLCHSSADKPAVRELYQKVRAEPWIQPWLDEEELFPGMDWNLEIEKAIEATDVILVCLSNNSITKEGYVQREIRIALDYADYKPEGALFIIPIRLEECTPPKRLARWQYADYFEGQRERGFQRLLASLKSRVSSIGMSLHIPQNKENKKSEIVLPKFYRRSIRLEYKVNADAKIVYDYLLQHYAGISFFERFDKITLQVDAIQAFQPNGKDIFQWGFVATGYQETARHGYKNIAGTQMTPDPIIEPISEMFLVSISQGQKGISILNFDTDVKHAHMFTTGLVQELSKAFSVVLVHQPTSIREVSKINDGKRFLEVTREEYEAILEKAKECVKTLPKIVVYCLYKWYSDELEINFDPNTDIEKINEANKAVEDGFLFAGNSFMINLDNPTIDEVTTVVGKLEEYLRLIDENEEDDLYEILLSEYGFDPFLSEKQYWEKILYKKALY